MKDLPIVPPFKKLLGPSFILLGLGLGSGEIILWPYLSSNYGLGLVWGIVIGVTMQFFINMEVERYALVHGESIFVGFAKWLKLLPLWFILSTFLGFGWPGIGLAGATLLFHATDAFSLKSVGVLLFLIIGATLTLGKVLYTTVEKIQKTLILFGTPFILLLTLYFASQSDWQALFAGLIGIGSNYRFLPANISLASFLAALTYSGAGGNLNLAQSFYVRDKGYGMGAYSQKIGNVFSSDHIQLTGDTFPLTPSNLTRFRQWWRTVNLEHFFIFWLLGLITMLMLSLLAYSTTRLHTNNSEGINFVLNEAATIGSLGPVFLLVTGLMLTATQLTVLDSTSRIITENVLLWRGTHVARVSKLYYTVLWIQIAFGIFVILAGFTQPRDLITLGAVINAFAMFVYTGLILYLNNARLAAPLRPSLWRNLILTATFIFLGIFCFYTIARHSI
ncbi:Nramp family divalent metal transporter [Candidatus Amesbacteria bacterium]|nr:Nramp family divalent metal transporter [Candidatus Amesbacteria bacterium]MBI2587212.1 Nramp family divalent metal transporter [Candidatus Amesbacteria bacterium]